MPQRRRYRPPERGGLFPDPVVVVSAGDFRAWPFRDCLMWAGGEDGILKTSRLRRIAAARGYRAAWVRHIEGRLWTEVWAESTAWWARRKEGYRR
jgi:hypothetical protein